MATPSPPHTLLASLLATMPTIHALAPPAFTADTGLAAFPHATLYPQPSTLQFVSITTLGSTPPVLTSQPTLKELQSALSLSDAPPERQDAFETLLEYLRDRAGVGALFDARAAGGKMLRLRAFQAIVYPHGLLGAVFDGWEGSVENVMRGCCVYAMRAKGKEAGRMKGALTELKEELKQELDDKLKEAMAKFVTKEEAANTFQTKEEAADYKEEAANMFQTKQEAANTYITRSQHDASVQHMMDTFATEHQLQSLSISFANALTDTRRDILAKFTLRSELPPPNPLTHPCASLAVCLRNVPDGRSTYADSFLVSSSPPAFALRTGLDTRDFAHVLLAPELKSTQIPPSVAQLAKALAVLASMPMPPVVILTGETRGGKTEFSRILLLALSDLGLPLKTAEESVGGVVRTIPGAPDIAAIWAARDTALVDGHPSSRQFSRFVCRGRDGGGIVTILDPCGFENVATVRNAARPPNSHERRSTSKTRQPFADITNRHGYTRRLDAAIATRKQPAPAPAPALTAESSVGIISDLAARTDLLNSLFGNSASALSGRLSKQTIASRNGAQSSADEMWLDGVRRKAETPVVVWCVDCADGGAGGRRAEKDLRAWGVV